MMTPRKLSSKQLEAAPTLGENSDKEETYLSNSQISNGNKRLTGLFTGLTPE